MTYLGINLKENNKIKKLNTWRDIVHSLWGLRKMLEWGNSSEWHWAEWGKRPVGEPPGEPCVCIPGEPECTFLDRRGKFQLSGLLLLLSIHKTNTESWRWSPPGPGIREGGWEEQEESALFTVSDWEFVSSLGISSDYLKPHERRQLILCWDFMLQPNSSLLMRCLWKCVGHWWKWNAGCSGHLWGQGQRTNGARGPRGFESYKSS